jgi:hypothetical protein
MTKLSDTQLVILTAACQRDDRMVLPLPDRLKGGAAAKVLDSLTKKGLIEEVGAKRGDPIWHETDDGHSTTLVVTEEGFDALGILPGDAPDASPDSAPQSADGPQEADAATVAAAPAEDAPVAPTVPLARKTRENSKQAQLIAMLQRPDGATIAEMAEALEWQHHTVRGALAGALKKKLGLDVTSEKVENRGRVYRLPA